MKRLSLFVLLLLAAFSLSGCRSSDYKAAQELYNSGKYEEAKTAFEALGDYKDSSSLAAAAASDADRTAKEKQYQEFMDDLAGTYTSYDVVYSGGLWSSVVNKLLDGGSSVTITKKENEEFYAVIDCSLPSAFHGEGVLTIGDTIDKDTIVLSVDKMIVAGEGWKYSSLTLQYQLETRTITYRFTAGSETVDILFSK